jgi:drug/metabolite transporter (DMT)-like permease
VTLALAALGVLCTAAGLLAYFALIVEAGPSRAAVITYLNPAVAVALGVAVLGEPLTAAIVAGFALIMAGSWLSTRPSTSRAASVPARR